MRNGFKLIMEIFDESFDKLNLRPIPTHKRGSSHSIPHSFCNSPDSNLDETQPESFDNFEFNLLKKSRLIGLAIPYKILARKIDSVSPNRNALPCIKVPLNKKMPFGKHSTQEIEPKFRSIVHSNRSIFLTEKKVKHTKLLSGRIK